MPATAEAPGGQQVERADRSLGLALRTIGCRRFAVDGPFALWRAPFSRCAALVAIRAPLGGELALVERAQLVQCRGLARRLVGANARDAREAEREARGVR